MLPQFIGFKFSSLLIFVLQVQIAFAEAVVDHPVLPELQKPEFVKDSKQIPFKLPRLPESKVEVSENKLERKIVITGVDISGNSLISSTELQNIYSNYLNQAITVADIEMLRQSLTRYYIDQGFVNSGVIYDNPAVKNGRLNLVVIEGKLNGITITGNERLDQSYISSKLLRNSSEFLNVNELRENFQLLLDDPLFERLNAQIIPGENLGDAFLDLQVHRSRPFDISAYLNNARAPSIGAEVVGANTTVRNLTGRGDLLSLSLEGSATGEPGHSYNLFWNMPINYTGTDFSASVRRSNTSLIEEPIGSLFLDSVLETKTLGLRHKFLDRLRYKFSLGIDYQYETSATKIDGKPFSFIPNETSGTAKTKSWMFWQEYIYRTERRVMALRSTFVSADTNLKRDLVAPAAIRVPDVNYNYWIGQAQFAQLFSDNGLQFIFRLTGQHTNDNLLSMDHISIGGMYSVRGFRENQLVRDNGYYANLEVEYPLVKGSEYGDFTIKPFIDYGKAWNTNEHSDHLFSAGLALKYKFKGLDFDIAWAKRLKYPDIVDLQSGDLQDKGVHFSIKYDLTSL